MRSACVPADYIPENIFRNPQRELYRVSVEPHPSCPRGGELRRIESYELLLRRFSCISMTHRFARDLSFNGVPLFLSLQSPFCRSYRRGNSGAVFEGRGEPGAAMRDKWHVNGARGVVVWCLENACKLGSRQFFYTVPRYDRGTLDRYNFAKSFSKRFQVSRSYHVWRQI